MSINSLIKNVKEMEKDGEVDPALTNYKKRRLMIMNGGGDLANSSNSTSSSGKGNESITASRTNIGFAGQDLEASDELRSLLFDALSPSDCSFLDDYI
ncbi:hypothetical protein QQ045_021813 [Rhodiola kirilowii]